MDCIYCGAELEWHDSYGNKDYILHGDARGKGGDIFKCPNHEGFETEQEALAYAKENNLDYDDWTEIVCDSACHSASGSFYTDIQGNLHEGYPC